MRATLIALTAAVVLAAPASASKFDLEYEASILNVLTLGKVTLAGSIDAAAYNATAGVKTAGIAVLFDQTDIAATSAGASSATGLQWSQFNLEHKYSKIGKPQKSRRVKLERTGGKVVETVQPKFGDPGKPAPTAAQKLAAQDPLTAFIAMGVQVGKTKTCGGAFEYFDGKQLAKLTLSPRSTGSYKGGGYEGKAVVCHLKYEPVAGFKAMSAADIAKIPVGEIWFADPGAGSFAAPVRIEVPTAVGPARLDVKRITIS